MAGFLAGSDLALRAGEILALVVAVLDFPKEVDQIGRDLLDADGIAGVDFHCLVLLAAGVEEPLGEAKAEIGELFVVGGPLAAVLGGAVAVGFEDADVDIEGPIRRAKGVPKVFETGMDFVGDFLAVEDGWYGCVHWWCGFCFTREAVFLRLRFPVLR